MGKVFDDLRKHKIEHETVCSQCIHFEICNASNIWSNMNAMEKICKNYLFGTSQGNSSCDQCTLRFTRYRPKEDSEYIPCFMCKFFIHKGLLQGKE